MKKKGKLESFTDLNVWKEGHSLVLNIYKYTEEFPNKEVYSLTDQMRRCVVSITSNIAEGFVRKGKREKVNFYYISKGSLAELKNQLLIARDLKYLKKKDFKNLANHCNKVDKLLAGLINSTKRNYRTQKI